MTRYTPFAILPAMVLLAACSSSSESGMDMDEMGGPQSRDEVLDLYTTVRAEVQAEPATAYNALPTSGTAQYAGAAEVLNDFGIGIIGTADITVAFAGSGDVNGTLSHFYQSNGEAVEGILTLDNGTALSGSGQTQNTPTISADVSGSLRSETGTLWTVAETTLTGTFAGASGEAFDLQGDADVGINGDVLPGEVRIFATLAP